MNKTKLTPQQKAYVKSIDSKKKRKKQKEEFLMHNFFDSILKESGDSTTTAIVLNFEPDQSQPIEKPSITKEILREVTDPNFKIIHNIKEEIQILVGYDISHLTFTFEANNNNFVFYKDIDKPYLYSVKVDELTFKDKLKIADKIFDCAIDLCIVNQKIGKFKIPNSEVKKTKLYTHEDMFNCFKESRFTTHPLTACFKHDSFAAYLKSLE